jgi:hypothetical protein
MGIEKRNSMLMKLESTVDTYELVDSKQQFVLIIYKAKIISYEADLECENK